MGGGAGIASDQKVVRAAFAETAIQDRTASDTIELAPNRSVIIRVLEHSPDAPLPLASVIAQTAFGVCIASATTRLASATLSAPNHGMRPGIVHSWLINMSNQAG